jgi:hypothetical protein
LSSGTFSIHDNCHLHVRADRDRGRTFNVPDRQNPERGLLSRRSPLNRSVGPRASIGRVGDQPRMFVFRGQRCSRRLHSTRSLRPHAPAKLPKERDQIEAIVSLWPMAAGQGKRRGRPAAFTARRQRPGSGESRRTSIWTKRGPGSALLLAPAAHQKTHCAEADEH